MRGVDHATWACPKCGRGTFLNPQRVQTRKGVPPVEVNHCARCGGVWFDRVCLEQALSVAIKDLAIADDAEEVGCKCPVDGRALWEFAYPQTLVKIDMCRKCGGLWLDKGEFREIYAMRKRLKAAGQLIERDRAPGLLSRLIELINSSISSRS